MSFRPLLMRFAGLLLAGCSTTGLESIGTPIGKISPEHFCPGDRLVAAYTIFEPEPCVPLPGHDHDCDLVPPPRVTFRASPPDFAETTVTALSDHVTFAPSADAVDVRFQVEPDPYGAHYPSERRDGTHHHEVSRILRSNTDSARLLTGTVDVGFDHPLRCDNGQPSYASVSVNYPEGYSVTMQPRRVCNLSTVPIEATLLSQTGSAPPLLLAPGACADTGRPEFNLGGVIALQVRSLALAPGATCSPLQGGSFPEVRTSVSLGCPP